jgi:hypothetical protein
MVAPGLSGLGRVAVRVASLHSDEPSGDAAGQVDLPGSPPGCVLAIVDGLGHGAAAAEAAQAAMRLIAEQPALELTAQLARLDAGLSATRGAAIGLARVDGSRLRYTAIGNTRALRWRGAQLLRLPSEAGVVGGGLPRNLPVTEIDLQADDWLVLTTDGLDEMLQLPVRLPEWNRDPGLLCEHLLARWRNARDDAGVLVFHVSGDRLLATDCAGPC